MTPQTPYNVTYSLNGKTIGSETIDAPTNDIKFGLHLVMDLLDDRNYYEGEPAERVFYDKPGCGQMLTDDGHLAIVEVAS